jgi:hypothetical protein
MDLSERTQILVQLRGTLEQTKVLYKSAKENLARAKQINPGDVSISQAEQLFDELSAAYQKALMEFNRFVIKGKGPSDPD